MSWGRSRFYICCLLWGILLIGCSQAESEESGSTAGDWLYRESFTPGETGAWHIEGDTLGRTAVENQQMIIDIRQPNLAQYTMLREPVFTDYFLEVEATPISGNPDSSYGILFRMAGLDQFYRFAVTGTGLYLLERYDGPDMRVPLMSDWAFSPAIQQGIGAVNRLAVSANGAEIKIYVNDQLLLQIMDSTYVAGNLALSAGTFNHSALTVAFDNLTVRKP